MEDRIAEIAAHATRFRRAVESCDRGLLPITFKTFPRGSCGDVTPLLGTYLQEKGLGVFEYVFGTRPDKASAHGMPEHHAWLRQGDVIVDITADQFPELGEAVVVSRHTTWHDSWTQEVTHAADYRVYNDGFARQNLETAYALLKKLADV